MTHFVGRLQGDGMGVAIGTGNEPRRDAWLEQALKEVPAGSRILDAGAGEQKYRSFCAHLEYVSQDFAQYDGRGDARGMQTGSWDQTRLDIVSDITTIPEPDASFDAIMCVEVFEHLPEPLLALKEFARLLSPGGQLVLTAPFCSLTHFAPYFFTTGFSRYFYERHLPTYGFEVVEIVENGNFFEYLAQEIRRLPPMARRYAGGSPRPWEYGVLYLVLRMLERFARRDRGSSEILHYGCFVRAVRK